MNVKMSKSNISSWGGGGWGEEKKKMMAFADILSANLQTQALSNFSFPSIVLEIL